MKEGFDEIVTQRKMNLFRELSNDTNPLHCDANYARDNNFKDVLVYGMLTSSFYSKLAGVYLPGKHCILQGIKIKFKNPVFVGDPLRIMGEIIYLQEAYKQVEIKASIVNIDNKVCSKATINAGLLVNNYGN